MNKSYDSYATEDQILLDPFQRCKFSLRADTTELGERSYAEVNTSQSSKKDNVIFITRFSH